MGCSPWGLEESDMTERLHFHFSLSGIGEGNGNPLQCSCLEYPRDGRPGWAAVYGVTQSQTRLKRLSSSSSIPLYGYTTCGFSMKLILIEIFCSLDRKHLIYFLNHLQEELAYYIMYYSRAVL